MPEPPSYFESIPKNIARKLCSSFSFHRIICTVWKRSGRISVKYIILIFDSNTEYIKMKFSTYKNTYTAHDGPTNALSPAEGKFIPFERKRRKEWIAGAHSDIFFSIHIHICSMCIKKWRENRNICFWRSRILWICGNPELYSYYIFTMTMWMSFMGFKNNSA